VSPEQAGEYIAGFTIANDHVSGELDESRWDDVEEAADACPLQVIPIDD
jgi:ferredoxin